MFLIPNSIAIIPPWRYKQAKKYSNVGIIWLEYMSIKLNVHIRHARNRGEKHILKKYYADSFIEPTNEDLGK